MLAEVAVYGKQNGDMAHDLISAALFAGLPRARVRELAGGLVKGPDCNWYALIQAQLAEADGLTNVELARRLYISPKTAAVHVSNILHKLGVASRTEVADVVHHG